MTIIKSVIVVAAIIIQKDRILIARKAPGKSNEGKWELPGGKVKEGETEPSALRREILEELGLLVEVHDFFMTNKHSFTQIDIELKAYLCSFSAGTIKLTDHDKTEWVMVKDLKNFQFSPADIPIIEKISSDCPNDYFRL